MCSVKDGIVDTLSLSKLNGIPMMQRNSIYYRSCSCCSVNLHNGRKSTKNPINTICDRALHRWVPYTGMNADKNCDSCDLLFFIPVTAHCKSNTLFPASPYFPPRHKRVA